MDYEHRARLIGTLEVIEATRGEILQLRHEIELARDTVARSQKLLSRTKSSAHHRAEAAKPL